MSGHTKGHVLFLQDCNPFVEGDIVEGVVLTLGKYPTFKHNDVTYFRAPHYLLEVDERYHRWRVVSPLELLALEAED